MGLGAGEGREGDGAKMLNIVFPATRPEKNLIILRIYPLRCIFGPLFSNLCYSDQLEAFLGPWPEGWG